MATTRHDVTPLLDIQNPGFACLYQTGAWWARYGDEQGRGPLPDTYLITNVMTMVKGGHFKNRRSAWFSHLGFFLGMIHGRLLLPETSELRPDVTTLVTLRDFQFTRGYRAGRVWFFYEADDHEHRLTDTQVIERVHEPITERRKYRDAQGTINFALGGILGGLSGQVFPLTQGEQERIQEEDRQFLAEYESRQPTIAALQTV